MKNNSPMLWAFKRIRKRIPAIVLMTVSYTINAFLGVAFALGTRGVIDSAVSGDKAAFLQACLTQLAIILGILLTLTYDRHAKERLLAELDRDWKRDLLHRMLHGDYAGVSAYHSGELLNRMNNDVRILSTGLINTVPSVAHMITKLISVIVVIVSMEPLFSLVALAAGALVLLVTSLMRRSLKGLNKRVSEEEGRVSGFLQETLEKLLMVQAMDVSQEMECRAEKLMGVRYAIQRKRKNVSLLSNTCISILAYGSGFAALVWCAGGLIAGTMTFGTLTAIQQLVSQIQSPIVNLSGVIPQFIAMTAAAERLQELDAVYSGDVAKREDTEELYENMTVIGAESLCFGYDRDRVFVDAQFAVQKGEFGVIMGHSGIGKSTLLKLMLGIFHPEKGSVYIETPEGKIPLDRTTRRLFAYVPQGNLLISGTLRENLILTRPDATEEQIQQAIYVSCMDDYLPGLPKGLETVIGESAAGLSEGQAQRLSIARAVLSDAPIMLLDEATSALDARTEELVLQRLRQLPGKTCIAVTHRPAAIALSDWSLEMVNGKCVLTHK